MANDIKLQSPEGIHPVDENLRPLFIGDKQSAIETAQYGNGAKVVGDLEVTGDIKGNITDVVKEAEASKEYRDTMIDMFKRADRKKRTGRAKAPKRKKGKKN